MADSSPYSQVSIVGYNSSPPSDDGAATSSNALRWSTHTSKIGDPLKTAIEAIDAATATAFSEILPSWRTGQTTEESSAGVTPSNYAIDTTDYLIFDRYGPDKTGATSSSSAWADLVAVMAQHSGGQVLITPGDYAFDSQITLTAQDENRFKIDAYGATFIPSGSISGLKISTATTNGGFTINGLKIKCLSDTNLTAGFDVVGVSRVRLNDCHVRAAGVSSSFAQFLIRPSDPDDGDTGAFWVELNNCQMRRNSSGDGTRPAQGVVVQGPCNALRIRGGELGDCDTVITFEEAGGTVTSLANGVLILGCALEGFTTGILVTADAAAPIGGLRIIGNRVEPSETATFLSLTGATSQPATPTMLMGNYLTPDASTYINNPNSLYYLSYDSATNPAHYPVLDTGGAFTIRNRAGNGAGLDVWTGLADSGIYLRDTSGNTAINFKVQSGPTADIVGGAETIEPIGFLTNEATATAIADVTNAINTTGKFKNKRVWDTTNNREMRASGATAASAWYVIDGSASVTPA